MWYKTAKKIMTQREAGFSNGLGDLRDTLQAGLSPFDHSDMFYQYLEETNPELAMQMDPSEAADALYDVSQEEFYNFKDWLEENISRGDYNDPNHTAMDWIGFSPPAWNVHLTDDANAIGDQGFQYGHPTLRGLHLTTHKPDEDRKKQPGYNFAFPADSSDAERATARGYYGKDAVMFYGGGADVYHYGDKEDQRLFWGKNVDPRMIFPIKRGEDRTWYIEDATGRVLVRGKSYAEVVEWVKTNYRMLQAIREKQNRQNLREKKTQAA